MTVRRSRRERRQVVSIYDEAKMVVDDPKEKEVLDSSEALVDDEVDSHKEKNEVIASKENDTEDEFLVEVENKEDGTDDEMEKNILSSSSEDSVEEDFVSKKFPAKKASTPTKSPTPQLRVPKSSVKKVQVHAKPLALRARRVAQAKDTSGAGGARKAVNSALASLAKKVLEESESPSNSLTASLLESFRPVPESQQNRRDLNVVSSQPITPFTPQLEVLAKAVIAKHNDDPNTAQISLINLIFRSVGGAVETNLDPNETRLEDMNNEEWGRVVTDLVDEMRHTPADRILLCADPDGAVHASVVEDKSGLTSNAPITNASLGAREYRKIYEEFWYILGGIALSEGAMSTVSSMVNEEEDSVEEFSNGKSDEGVVSDDDQPKSSSKKSNKRKSTFKSPNSKKSSSFTTTTRFDAELVRDLITRVTELVSVGQPDVRAAACIAALQIGHSILDQTIVLCNKIDVASRQYAVASGGKGNKQNSKAESLKHQIDSLKRTRADLEEVVLGPIIQGVFIHRYRDSNMFVRALNLNSLSRMMIQRPDMFLVDRFLKYFGWMMSDKAECVRIVSLKGLRSPSDHVHSQSTTGNNGLKIDLSSIEHVSGKFLPRISDCVVDISVKVQEEAIKLLLSLLRDGFLDDVEDEKIWNQINLRALASDASPMVRRDALYFIMEQLEAFDEGADADDDVDSNEGAHRKPQKKIKNTNRSAELLDRRTAQRLDAIASWAAHALSDGPVPLDKINVSLADYLVYALRDMPEHRSLVTNWAALLRAISDDNVATTTQGTTAGDRADIAKQRVLIQMLACAARAEVNSVADAAFLRQDVDPDVVTASEDFVALSSTSTVSKKGITKPLSTGLQHEELSVALLTALPKFLVKFKSDAAILASLTSLPRYLIPTVFSLPQRKGDFLSLAKELTEIYLQSTDEIVLRQSALSMAYLARGDHARAADARLQLQKVTRELRLRVLDHLSNIFGSRDQKTAKGKTTKSSTRSKLSSSRRQLLLSDDEGTQEERDFDNEEVEYALYLNLRRLCVLAKRVDIAMYLHDETDDESDPEFLFNAIADGLIRRLTLCKPVHNSDESNEGILNNTTTSNFWVDGSSKTPGIIAGSVHEGLVFLLSFTAWAVLDVQEKNGLVVDDEDVAMENEEDDEEDIEDHLVLRFRDRLASLLELCFDQFLSKQDDVEIKYTPEQITFADTVQHSASQIASDLRTLFPKEWRNAASPLLRAFALSKDDRLIGGSVRYFRSKEAKLRSNETLESEDKDAVLSLLLPLGRSVATNWADGNRQEAGAALAHVTGSGQEASNLATTLSRVLKRVDSVRLLEAQMTSLRQSYEDWMNNEPEEIESDRPTDEEMAAFEEAERNHDAQFQALEHQASRFSMSLGVGKLSDRKLSPALLGFVKEGVRFSFSSNDIGGGIELVLGSRLSFLKILSKYANWIRKDKNHREIVRQDLDERESALRSHKEFAEVHEDDLAALSDFRAALGLKTSDVLNSATVGTSAVTMNQVDAGDESQDSVGELSSPSTQKSTPLSKQSRRSTHGSTRSLISSVQGSLSPLYEEDASVEDEMQTPSSSKFGSSVSRKRSRSQVTDEGKTQSTFDGEISSGDDLEKDSDF